MQIEQEDISKKCAINKIIGLAEANLTDLLPALTELREITDSRSDYLTLGAAIMHLKTQNLIIKLLVHQLDAEE